MNRFAKVTGRMDQNRVRQLIDDAARGQVDTAIGF
jgi:hypothetical protein